MGATNSARRLSKPVTAKNKNKTGAAGDKGYRKYLWTLIFSWIPSDLLSTTYCDFPYIHYSEEVTWLWRWRMTRSSWPMLTSPSWIFWRGSSRDMCRCPERAGCGRWVFSSVALVSLNKECISDDLLLQDEWGRKTHNDTGLWILNGRTMV